MFNIKANRYVIVGAGQTGRGFIARLLNHHNRQLTFVDKNKTLIRSLVQSGKYSIDFFGHARPPQTIDNFDAHVVDSEASIEAMAKAEVVFTAVGESHITQLVPVLERVVEERKRRGIQEKLTLITCENGIQPKKALVDAGLNTEMNIAEGIVFCTTIAHDENSLDLISEVYDEIPYDIEALEQPLSIAGFKPTTDFSDLIERKIFTYNCYSACISYIGDYKRYTEYAEAALDPDISLLLDSLSPSLNQSLAAYYQVDLAEQEAFAALAVKKFQNRAIKDTIARNTRDVQRKLSPNERMIKPLYIMGKYGQNTEVIELVIAAAIHFGMIHDAWKFSAEEVLKHVCQLEVQAPEALNILKKYEWFKTGKKMQAMIEQLT